MDENVEKVTFRVVGRACSSTASPITRGRKRRWRRKTSVFPTAIFTDLIPIPCLCLESFKQTLPDRAFDKGRETGKVGSFLAEELGGTAWGRWNQLVTWPVPGKCYTDNSPSERVCQIVQEKVQKKEKEVNHCISSGAGVNFKEQPMQLISPLSQFLRVAVYPHP